MSQLPPSSSEMSTNTQTPQISTPTWNVVNPSETQLHRCQTCGEMYDWLNFNKHINDTKHKQSQENCQTTPKPTTKPTIKLTVKPPATVSSNETNPPQASTVATSARIISSAWEHHEAYLVPVVRYELETDSSSPSAATVEGLRDPSAENAIIASFSADPTAPGYGPKQEGSRDSDAGGDLEESEHSLDPGESFEDE